MIGNDNNSSAVGGKASFMMMGKPMMTAMIPQSHKRKSGYKLSLLSGSVGSSQVQAMILNGDQS